MHIQDIIKWCLDHWAFTAFVIACFVQITPVFKFNPFTVLFSWLGKIVNADVICQIEDIKGTIKDLEGTISKQQDTIDENERDRIRFEVLDFANSCRNGRKHTKDEFEHIIVLKGKYERLLEKSGDSNGVFDAEYDYIKELYRNCQRSNSFL